MLAVLHYFIFRHSHGWYVANGIIAECAGGQTTLSLCQTLRGSAQSGDVQNKFGTRAVEALCRNRYLGKIYSLRFYLLRVACTWSLGTISSLKT